MTYNQLQSENEILRLELEQAKKEIEIYKANCQQSVDQLDEIINKLK